MARVAIKKGQFIVRYSGRQTIDLARAVAAALRGLIHEPAVAEFLDCKNESPG